MPTMIENMKEIAKQKLLGIGAAMAVPGAIATDVAKNTAKAIPNLALGAVGAMTGLEAPKKAYGWGATNDIRSIQSEIANSENMAKEGLKKNVREGLKGLGFTEPVPTSNLGAVNQPLINMVKGEGLGAMSKANPSVATPTVSTVVNAPATKNPTATEIAPPAGAISRPEGDPNFFKGGATFQPTGATTSTGMSEKDLEDWKARGALANSRYSDGKNPNDSKLSDMMEELVKTASSGSPSIERATKLNALKLGIQTLAPMSSYGAFGVAGLQTDTTKRGQDVLAETTRRGQDLNVESNKIAARLKADENLIDSFYKSGLLEQGKEELGIKRMVAEAKDSPSFLKLAIQASPKIKTIDANGAETEAHDVQAGIKMLTDSGFETPKGFKMPAPVARPSLTPEQARAELERRKALKK
jgi:hypothetical protein